MAHPIFSDPPSRDMTAAQQRQQELDAQIEAFLAKGGQIQAFDQLHRPVESAPWSAFTINPRKASPAPIAEPVAPAVEAPKSPMVETPPPEIPTSKPERARKARFSTQDEERLAVKIIVEAALGSSPRVIAKNLHIPLNRCQAIAEQYHVHFHR